MSLSVYGRQQAITERQLDILLLSTRGLTKSQVGKALWVTEDTVKTHLKRLYAFYGVSSLVEALSEALRRADLELDPATRKIVAGRGLKALIPTQSRSTAHMTTVS